MLPGLSFFAVYARKSKASLKKSGGRIGPLAEHGVIEDAQGAKQSRLLEGSRDAM